MEKNKIMPFWGGLFLIVLYYFVQITVIILNISRNEIFTNPILSVLFSLPLFFCFLRTQKTSLCFKIFCFGNIFQNIIYGAERFYYFYYKNDIYEYISLENIVSNFGFYFAEIVACIFIIIGIFKNKKVYSILGMCGYLILLIFGMRGILQTLNIFEFFYDKVVGFAQVLSAAGYIIMYGLIILVCCKALFGNSVHTKKTIAKKVIMTEDTLESLKEKFDSGQLSIEEYAAKKAEIMQNL